MRAFELSTSNKARDTAIDVSIRSDPNSDTEENTAADHDIEGRVPSTRGMTPSTHSQMPPSRFKKKNNRAMNATGSSGGTKI